MKIKTTILFSILFITLGFFVFKINKNKSFDKKTIQFDFPYNQDFEIDPLSKEQLQQIDSILAQKFTYLGKGARLLSFLSADGLYVLKFFKYRYHEPHFATHLPAIFPFKNYKLQKMKKVSLYTVLNGYKIAYQHDAKSTGLIYIHLNETNNEFPDVLLVDKQGKPHLIDLDNTRFVIQLKVDEFKNVLTKLLENQNLELAKQRLCQIIDLYLSHYKKGLFDLGVGILDNNGFLEDEPIHFDVSKMTIDEKVSDPEFQKERLKIMTKKIDLWLLTKFPEYRDEIMFNINSKLYTIGL